MTSLKDKSLYPPLNFSFIESGLYRSAYYSELNSAFLDTLSLKTIIALEEDYPSAMESYSAARGIKIFSVISNHLFLYFVVELLSFQPHH